MNIPQAIMHLHPQANPLADFIVQDDSDGNGPYIAKWNLESPEPTEEQLQSAWEAMQPTPEQVLSQSKQSKTEELNSKCNTTILSGFKSNALGTEHTYDFDYEAQTNLNSTLNAIAAGIATEPILWKASGMPQPHSFEQFKALNADGLAHKNANISKYWELKTALSEAKTEEEISSITW
ncbi:XkdW family protein [Paenibacillus sp. HWE-109]|uniref:XkdW family protein n=1 Tax=Paenibacillus sp. HWE-109 TaxID=1306526 RepID=UPI001EDDE5BD|nr:XkdW family protein [Paenibacillus sp. HWE-109]UKS24876.1 XkdW family protein [Paenibacillus sp. HWE-109]